MSTKKWRELLGGGDSRLAGVGGRSGEEAIGQIGGTECFRGLFRIPRAIKRTLLSLPEAGGIKWLLTLFVGPGGGRVRPPYPAPFSGPDPFSGRSNTVAFFRPRVELCGACQYNTLAETKMQ